MSSNKPSLTRRELLSGAACAGVAATTLTTTGASAAELGHESARTIPREAFENLTATESQLLERITERLIPSDEHGPGAKEARVAHYIDRALGGALANQRQTYASGLAALERYARSSRGKSFLELSGTDQDSVLIDCETGGATGFTGSSAQFFAMLLSHVRQGMFGDPYYGGNAGFVGWDLIGYPGVRTAVSPTDQTALEAGELATLRRSAYDYASFNKATAHLHDEAHDHSMLASELSHGK